MVCFVSKRQGMRKILWFLLTVAALASPIAERMESYVEANWKDFQVTDVRRKDAWCVVDMRKRDDSTPAQLLFHEDDGWRLIDVKSRSLTLGPENLLQAAVPAAEIPYLLATKDSQGRPPEYPSYLSQRALNTVDGYPTDSWSLMLARNEIYAHRGRVFTDPVLKSFFASLPWYHPRPQFRDSDLSAIEKANVRALQLQEQKARKTEAVLR